MGTERKRGREGGREGVLLPTPDAHPVHAEIVDGPSKGGSGAGACERACACVRACARLCVCVCVCVCVCACSTKGAHCSSRTRAWKKKQRGLDVVIIMLLLYYHHIITILWYCKWYFCWYRTLVAAVHVAAFILVPLAMISLGGKQRGFRKASAGKLLLLLLLLLLL